MESAAKARKTRRGDSAAVASRAARPSPPPRGRIDSQDATTDVDGDEDTQLLDEERKESEPVDDANAASHQTQKKPKKAKKAKKSGKRKRRDRAEADAADEQSELGVIEEVYCENFMCHRKLRVQLTPHINFITGENGSGKSAILAAIQICLGASARSTHRGRTIRSLIRHGHEGHALVRVTLRNDAATNSDAFRPELFGKRISVERLIRRDGSAEYRLKSESDVTVTKLKDDVDALLDHLNIQTENPCVVLDQDNAKKFVGGSPEDKYRFFLESTSLFKLRILYAKIADDLPAYHDVVRRETGKLAALQVAMDEAKERWEDAKSISALESQMVEVKKELAWAFVAEQELAVQKVVDRIQKVDLQKMQEVSKRAAFKVQALEEKLQQRSDELEAMSARARDAQRPREATVKRIKAEQQQLHKREAELQRNSQDRTQAKQRIQRLERSIEEKRRAHEADLQSRSQQSDEMQRQAERSRDALVTVQRDLDAAKQSVQQSREALDDLETLEQQHQDCVSWRRRTEREMQQVQDRLSGLRSQKQNRLAVYGNRIPRLQQLIDENVHRFEAPPIGPLGTHVRLPEKFMRFAVPIEVALKGTLHSYLVHSGRDKALLDELRRQARCPPHQGSCLIAARTGRRYSNLRLPAGDLAAYAICNLLEVDDNDAFNALVDVCGIESKLVFDDKATAEARVLQGHSGSFRMAPNVSEAYVTSGDKFIVRNGNLAFIANKGPDRRSIICQDVEGEIDDLEAQLQDLRENSERLQRDEERLRRQCDDWKSEIRHQRERVDRLSQEFYRRRVELRSVEEELAEDTQDATLDLSVFEAAIDEAKSEIGEADKREVELREQLAERRAALDGLHDELDALKREEAKTSSELAKVTGDVGGLYKLVSEAKALALRTDKEAALAQQSVNKWEVELRLLRAERNERADKAKTVCGCSERVRVSKSVKYYGEKLTDLRGRVEAERSRFHGMDLGALKADKIGKKTKFKQKKEELEAFKANVEQLQSSLQLRVSAWESMQKSIASTTSHEFNAYMNLNNFAGRLKFLHDAQRLEIAVVNSGASQSKQSKITDMKELSGGERSFTQVALLVALGKSIECPFRVMDEFDVFMDAVNRDTTIQVLVDAAKADARKQFLFVTPNDLSTLRRDPKVKIQKMDPPRDRLNADQQA